MKRASAKSATQHSGLALCWPWATGVLRRIPCKPGRAGKVLVHGDRMDSSTVIYSLNGLQF